MSDYCNYCQTDKDGYVRPLDKNGHMYIWPYNSQLRIRYYGQSLGVEVKYCPMCGRKLREEEE